MAKKSEGTSKAASLPQLLETTYEDRQQAVAMLEDAVRLKLMIGVQPDEKKNVEGSGLLKEFYEKKQALSVALLESGLDGLRHNNIVFMQRLQNGRSGVDMEKFFQILVSKYGVKVEDLIAARDEATKQGEPFWVRELDVLGSK